MAWDKGDAEDGNKDDNDYDDCLFPHFIDSRSDNAVDGVETIMIFVVYL